MGGGFVVFIWAFILFCVGLPVGLLVALVILPRVWKWLGKTGPSGILKLAFTLVFAIVFSVSCSVLLVVWHTWNSGDYYKDPGSFDYSRMPLVFPYEMVMIDVLDDGGISKWDPESSVSSSFVWNIDSLALIDSMVVGHRLDDQYFIFDCCDENILYLYNREELEATLKMYGADSVITLESVRDHYNRYWDEH